MGRTPKPYRTWYRKELDRYYIQFPANPGKWIPTPCKTIGELEIWVKNYDPATEKTRITVREYTQDFFIPGRCRWLKRQNAKGREYSIRYIRRMRGILNLHIVPWFGKFYLSSVTRRELDDCLIDAMSVKEGWKGRPLGPSFKNDIIAAFKIILDEAVDEGLIDRNPIYGITRFRGKQKERRIFSVDELQLLFPEKIDDLVRVWGSYSWATFFFLMGSCGLRPGEVCALQWGDWYRTLHGLVIGHSIEMPTRRRKSTKTGNRKPAALTRRAEGLLLILESMTEKTDPGDFIFLHPWGAPYMTTETLIFFKNSCMRAGIDLAGRTQYCLRHSFNTHALKLLDRTDVRALMGHRSDGMTVHYDHPDDADLIERVPATVWERLEQMWG